MELFAFHNNCCINFHRKTFFFLFLDIIFFSKKFILWHEALHITYLNVDRQVCVIKTVAYRARTDTHTPQGQKKVNTEGPCQIISFTFRLWSLAFEQFLYSHMRISWALVRIPENTTIFLVLILLYRKDRRKNFILFNLMNAIGS